MTPMIRNAVPSVALLVAQLPVAWAVITAIWCARRNWADALGSAPLPFGTATALGFGVAVPIAAAFAAAVILYCSVRRQTSCDLWLLATAICEVMALALFALALFEPALYISYSVTPRP
jgi:hypothetical protein